MAYDPSPLDTSPTTIQTIKAGGDKINENFTELPNMLADKVDKVVGKQLSTEDYTTAEKDKLAGIEAGATANATDAQLRDRTTHTGTQPHTTITGLGSSATADIGTDSGEVIGTDEAREYFDITPRTSVQPTLSSNFSRNKHERYELYGNEPKTILQQWDVNRNSTATYIDANGVLQTAAPHQPRIDYSSGEGRLLVEGQSTNLLTWSEDFSNSVWDKGSRLTVSANVAIAPDNTVTADKLVETLTSESRILRQDATVSTGIEYVLSGFFKRAERSFVRISLFNAFTSAGIALNLDTGQLAVTNGAPEDYGVVDEGNGWFRLWIKGTATTNFTGQFFGIFPSTGLTITDITYQGDGTSGIYVWGAQLEQTSSPSSYIKTEASSVTRIQDIITPKGDA